MARYKSVDRHLSKLLPVTFEYAVNWLTDHKIDMRVLDARYRNDDTGSPAFDPSVLPKIVLLGYAVFNVRGLADAGGLSRPAAKD
ncbi:MAG: hypothetical protein VYC42_05320 [Pseudomonadota bacterium]|nr:hypothetical protein [Pseudomonadota bacterium]